MAKKRVGIRNGALFNQTSTLWNNLVAYYTGDGTPDDALGTYNGTLTNGATYGIGKINQGFSFDGVNDFVDCGSISEINSSSTVSYSYWGKKTASNKHLLVGSQINTTNGFWLSWWSDGNVYCSARNGNYSYTSYALPFDTNWHHFVGVYNGTSIKIYIDGVLQATNTTGVPATLSSTSGNDFNIGYLESKYTDGNIDEVGVWDRELTSTEVTELYNSGVGKQYTPPVVSAPSTPSIITDGLVLNLDAGNTLSYPGTGTDWFDLTSNNNDGVLVNGVSYLTDNGGVMSFDGVNDYTTIPQSDLFKFGTGDFCYDVWFNSNNITNSNGGLWDRLIFMGNTVYTNSFSVNANPNGYQIRFNDVASITTSIIPINTWTNLTIQRVGGVLYTYINGILDKSSSNNYNMDTAADYELNLGFAGIRFPNGSYFNGNISSVRIYNNALTESQIQQNYNATKGRFGL